MKEIQADFYNGHTSVKIAVTLGFDEVGQLHILGLPQEIIYPVSKVRITSRVGNTPRSIYFPDGSKCETRDNDLIDKIVANYDRRLLPQWLHLLESRWHWIGLALLLLVVISWSWIEFGIPYLARYVAYALPTSTDTALGEGTLKTLDRIWFDPSQLEPATQNHLTELFNNMTLELNDTHTYRLEFRHSNTIGANALALPAGIIVITDELVQLAEHDHELVAIFAHEIGHVIHRHTLRHVLQNSAVGLVIAAVMGDVFSISSLSVALPTLLIEAKYSREFETEADHFALTYLKNNKIATYYMAKILLRLQRERDDTEEVPTYLSSHPATSQRIKLFETVDTLSD